MHEDSPEDVVHDVFTEALWPGHPLGRPDPRDRGAHPCGHARDACAASTGATTSRATWSSRWPATSGTSDLRPDAARPHGDGRRARSRARSAWNLRAHGRAPKPSGGTTVRRKKTEQAHVVLGTNGLAAHRPRPVRLLGREHGAGRWDELAAVPGDPREARARLHGVQLPRAVHGGRAVQRLRRHDAGAADEVVASDAARARGRPRRRAHARRSSTVPRATCGARPCCRWRTPAAGCRAWGNPRSRTARSSRSTRRSAASRR